MTGLPRITDVWTALGGSALHHGRGRAFWRNGDGYNVAIDAGKNAWYDYVAGEGGGIVALVQRALSSDRRDAFVWLQEHFGVPSRPLSQGECREWARRRAAAEQEATVYLRWRKRMLDHFRGLRNAIWAVDRRACRWALAHIDDPVEHPAWELAWLVWQKLEPFAERLNRAVELIEGANQAELLYIFRNREAA